MTQDTRELLARALRRAAEAWDKDADKWGAPKDPEESRLRSDAVYARGFAEALENGCDL